MSFSTILPGDTNPFGKGRGGAEGCVGIVVDIGKDTKIDDVYWCDTGSNELGSLGLDPTEENCAQSIDKRKDSNEWRIKDFISVGIFILEPIFVRRIASGSELPMKLEEVISLLPDRRIFTANAQTFLELDRHSMEWQAIAYEKIIPPSSA